MEPRFRIAVVNSRYFLSGGPERYLFNFSALFGEKGHSISPFALRYRQNEDSPYSRYFPRPPAKDDQIYFRDLALNLPALLRLAARSLYSFEVKRGFSSLLQNENIQITYLLQHYGTLSPSVIDASCNLGIPVVLRTSDFFLMCLNSLFLKRGSVCEDCVEKSLWSGVRDRCVKNSFWMSLFRALSLWMHRQIKIYEKVDAFVCPTLFMTKKLEALGIPSQKIHHLPTFFNADGIRPERQSDPYILYFGRTSKEKGVDVLVRAWKKLDLKNEKLLIVGHSHDGETERLKKWITEEKIGNIEFKDFQSTALLAGLISRSRFTVVPSVWYENMPNTILESFAHAKPVVASDIGSIPETVRDGEEGLLFQAGNADDLAQKMSRLLSNPQEIVEMGKNARRRLEEDFSPKRHYKKLLSIFRNLHPAA